MYGGCQLGTEYNGEVGVATRATTLGDLALQLQTADARLRVVLDQLPAVVWTMDRELAVTSITGTRANAAFDADVATIQSACQRALQGETLAIEIEMGGAAYQSRIQPLRDSRGDVRGVVGCALDVSHARDLERQFHAAQRMESVGRLAGGIAHDFNNVLTIIECYTKFLYDDAPAGSTTRDDITAVKEAAGRAEALVRQLLAFSRRQVQALEVLDPNEVIRDLHRMLGRTLGEDIEIAIHLQREPSRIKADRAQLEQILLNLAVNARDAMPDGGTLTIETQTVRLDDAYVASHMSVVPGNYVLLAMTDTGTGMDAMTRSRVFDPFFTTKESGKGTGLGLSTVFGIVKQSGGNIWLYSEPGVGTTFKVYLPAVADAPSARLRAVAAPVDLTGTETVLIVEDDRALRAVAERTLVQYGYHVLAAGSADEALAVVREHQGAIHLMLADVVMPGVSGTELGARVAPLRPDMRVMYTSGFSDHAVVRHQVVGEEVAFLPKPYSPDDLLRAIRLRLDLSV
jgi:signal transduction histidine kinase